MSTLRIGLNIHNKARGGQERSAEEKIYLPQFMRQLNPSAIVVMDDFNFAQDMHSALPQTIVCYRQYNPAEGHLFKVISPEQYVINQTGITKPGMPLYVLNEMDSKAPNEQLNAACKWMARVIELIAVKGCVCVIDNEGPGQPTLSWFTDDLKWNAVKPLFDAFQRYPQMYWGLHPYWHSGDLQPTGQSAIHRQIEPLLKARGYNMPLIIFSETGRDALGGSKTNGWRTAGISEEVYAAEIVKARNTLWTENYIRGVAVYCYGSTEPRWQAFDIEQAKILHTALIGANQSAPPQQPPQQPPIVIPPEPPALPFDIVFCNAQIAALELQIAAWKRLKQKLEIAAKVA